MSQQGLFMDNWTMSYFWKRNCKNWFL